MPLIGTIHAIWVTIAHPFFLDTNGASPLAVLFTREFTIGIASPVGTLAIGILIRVIKAVVVAITNINVGNAIAIVASEEIPIASSVFGGALVLRLIFAIGAIWIAIAVPSGWQTTVIVTSERIDRTFSGTTMEFIFVRVVAAVIVSIA